jgi:Ca-activated chloride channel family protein
VTGARAVSSGLLSLAAAAALSAQTPVFRGRVDLVNMGVTVTDRKGGIVGDLAVRDFRVVEDGREQTLSYFAAGDVSEAEAPALHLGVLIDVSRSMAEDIGFVRTAAIKFLNTLTNAVDVTLVDFDLQVRVTRYTQNDFARLVERIRSQKLGDYTAMYDAIGVYLDGAADQDGRKVMVLYTDGGDTRSTLRYDELLKLLRASDVTVYAIGALGGPTRMGRGEERLVLQRIAEETGGQAYFPMSVKELDKIYDQIAAEVRAQYTLGYVSSNTASDGRWRKVEISVTRPGLKDVKIRSRRGYFAPYQKPSQP